MTSLAKVQNNCFEKQRGIMYNSKEGPLPLNLDPSETETKGSYYVCLIRFVCSG